MSSYPPDTVVGSPTPADPARGGTPRKVRRVMLIGGLATAVVVAGTLAGGEAYARTRISHCISSGLEQSLGTGASVHFGPKPLLLTMVDHKVPYVTVDTDDASVGQTTGIQLHARLNDIDTDSNNASVGSSSATATWSDAGIAQTLNGLVSGVQSDPDGQSVDVQVLGGLAQLKLIPQVVDGKIEVTTSQAQLLGIGLPTDLVSGIVSSMTGAVQTYPLDMKPTAVKVVDNGIRIDLEGGHSNLAAPDGTQPQMTC
ncbi:LmeA family phospholipid-binding protein [Nocardia stercoris]|uniref:DUF2993 domain-containing protein n=1 Tax=Nocardia stercoris TaxID=2483361 RepID=A0A3M2L0B5_9NOCA|nr:DUF2993 domain-containing protein [Nocardia stercoris]RMI30834.1 DUF2993 domain-containing protein [Nocardia stercoris]